MPATLEDVQNVFQLLLGRKASPPFIIEEMQRRPIGAALHRVTRSSEFQQNVIDALASGNTLIHQRRWSTPPRHLLEWLSRRTNAPAPVADGLTRADGWEALFGYIFADEWLSKTVISPEAREAFAAKAERAVARAPIVVNPVEERAQADADALSVRNVFLVALGVRLKDDDKRIAEYSRKPLSQLLRWVFQSGDFDTRVLSSLIDQRRAPHDSAIPRPGQAIRDWAARTLPLGTNAMTSLASAQSWRQVLLTLLGDPFFCRVALSAARTSDVVKVQYLLARAQAALSAGQSLVPHQLRVNAENWSLDGRLVGIAPEGATVRLSFLNGNLRAVSTLEADAGLGTSSFSIPFPDLAPGTQHYFARIDVVHGEALVSQAPGAIRFDPPVRIAVAKPEVKAKAPGVKLDRFGRFVAIEDVPDDTRLVVDGAPLSPRVIAGNRKLFEIPAAYVDGRSHRIELISDAAGPLRCAASLEIVDTPLNGLIITANVEASGFSIDAFDPTGSTEFALLIDGEAVAHTKPGLIADEAAGVLGVDAGFRFALPDNCCDGGAHHIVVERIKGEMAYPVGSADFTYDLAAFQHQVSDGDPATALPVLRRAAQIGRADLIADWFSQNEAADPLDGLEILLTTMVSAPLQAEPVIRPIYDEVWASALAGGVKLNNIYNRLAGALLAAIDGLERRVATIAPLKDAVIDLSVMLWRRDRKDAAGAATAIRRLFSIGRFSLAETILVDALAQHEDNADLLSLSARLRSHRGDLIGAQQDASSALAKKPNHREAQVVLSRLAQEKGDHLEAMRLATSGRGIAQGVIGGEIDARLARTAFPLGWTRWAREAFPAGSGGEFDKRLSATEKLLGTDLPADQRSFSVFYIPPQLRKGSLADDFAAYGSDCSLVVRLEDEMLGGAPVVGAWAVFLRDDAAVTPAILHRLLGAARIDIHAVRYVEFDKDGSEKLKGLVMRSTLVEHLDRSSLKEADAMLKNVLRTVTVFA